MWMKKKTIRQFYQDAEDKESAIVYMAKTNGCGVDVIREILFDGEPEPVPGCEKEEKDLDGNNKKKIDYDKVRELYNTGMTDRAIASELGAGTSSAIYLWRKKNGLPAVGRPVNQRADIEPDRGFIDVLRDLMALCKPGDSDNVKEGFRVLTEALLAQEMDRLFVGK